MSSQVKLPSESTVTTVALKKTPIALGATLEHKIRTLLQPAE